MAEDGRLSKYGEFALIDSLCREYPYTHEQVFCLSWSEVMTILALRKERQYIEYTAEFNYRADEAS